MSVTTYPLNLVFQGVNMSGIGGQYAPEYPATLPGTDHRALSGDGVVVIRDPAAADDDEPLHA